MDILNKKMKSSAMLWVLATTLILVVVTIMAALEVPFNWVFYLTVAGQIMLVYMVYKVLTENYDTNKTFDDYYEDFPRVD